MMSKNATRVLALVEKNVDDFVKELKNPIENVALKLALNTGIPITRKELSDDDFILSCLKILLDRKGAYTNKTNDKDIRRSNDPIRLTGDDAVAFYNALYRPTDEDIQRRAKILKQIDDEVKITETDDGGFIAEFKDLAL